ncbi:MAG: response regulator [Chloroflexi bacterium]|nr:response regulator [Chloroflexota bacterium]
MTDQPKIFVLDDERAMLDLATVILQRADYDVHPCDNPFTAIEYMRYDPPHIIVLDTVLSLMDGFEVCRKIRSDERTAHVPIVVLSNDEQRESWLTAQHAGADVFIPKTRMVQMLVPTIERLLVYYPV